jgi:hypothetical protein
MAYHIVPGLYYLNNIDSFNYPTLLQNTLVNAKLGDNIYLNWHIVQENGQPVEKFITVIEEESNQQAKNGVFHAIDTILEPWIPSPVRMTFDFTDYQGLSMGRIYTEKDLKDIDGITSENTSIYFRNSTLNDGETNLQTTSSDIGWAVEFELPPILRGDYYITLYWASDQSNSGLVQLVWDGSALGTISLVHNKRWPGTEWLYNYNTSTFIGRFQFAETETHTIKFIALKSGLGCFDYIEILPVDK